MQYRKLLFNPSPLGSWRRGTKGLLKSDTGFLFDINNSRTHSYVYQPLILGASLILCEYLLRRFSIECQKNQNQSNYSDQSQQA